MATSFEAAFIDGEWLFLPQWTLYEIMYTHMIEYMFIIQRSYMILRVI